MNSSFRWTSLLLVVWIALVRSASGSELVGAADTVESDTLIQVSHNVADALVDALADASSPIHKAAGSNSATSAADPPKRKLQRWVKGIKSILSFPWSHVSNNDKDATDTNQNTAPKKEEKATKKKQATPSSFSKKRLKAFEAFRFYNTKKADPEDAITGTRILSGSFRVLSTSAGYVAAGVRVSGDTAAGLMGSSVKWMGTAVKSVGTGLSSASRVLEIQQETNGPSSGPSSNAPATCPSDNKTTQPTTPQDQTAQLPPLQPKKRPIFKRSRQAAAKSVRLAGALMDGLGESLLIAGAATESLASSTATVAVETVRILEDLAGTVSLAISLRGRRSHASGGSTTRDASTGRKDNSDGRRLLFTPPFLSFGTYDRSGVAAESAQDTRDSLWRKLRNNPSVEDAYMLAALLASDISQFGIDVSADTEGIPSMANEMAAALLFCYLLSVLLLSQSPKEESRPNDKTDASRPLMERYSLGWLKTRKKGKSDNFVQKGNVIRISMHGLQRGVWSFIWLPWRLVIWACHCLLCFVFSRRMLLLGFYSLVWIYLSRLSQQRVSSVQRRAEAIGFRNGLSSLSAASPPTETLLWLNHALESLWRVKNLQSDGIVEDQYYPIFVSRAFDANESYGGLEPFISAAIGSGLVKGLEVAKSMRPTDVAYVSLFSLSLGRRPPMIRSVSIGNEVAHGDNTQIELDLEIDAFLEDLSMIFEVKLSSLSYALLPSTKIKIFNLNFRASMKAVMLLRPEFPFVSEVQLSMSAQPFCDFRAAPVGKDRGLNGVELGSIPFLNDWIREAIRSGLSNYVSPRHVTIDIAELLHRGKQEQLSMVPSIDESLRRRTRNPISSPRTSMPHGVAITSVADQLESRQSSLQAAGAEVTALLREVRKNKKKSILRPVTELSRLALDRHDLKEGNLVRPVTELARLGMDRWLESAVMATRRKSNESSEVTWAYNATLNDAPSSETSEP